MRWVSWLGAAIAAAVIATAYIHTRLPSYRDIESIQHSIDRLYSKVEKIDDKLNQLLVKRANRIYSGQLEITRIPVSTNLPIETD